MENKIETRWVREIEKDKFYDFIAREWCVFNDSRGIVVKKHDYCFGAYEKGNLVGCGDLDVVGDTGKMENLIIHRKKRGMGFGKMLLDIIEEKAIEEDCRQLVLMTSDIHYVAKEIYLKRDFEIVAELPHWTYDKTWYAMRKWLK